MEILAPGVSSRAESQRAAPPLARAKMGRRVPGLKNNLLAG